MRILVAEDDDYKRDQLVAEIATLIPGCIFECARSFRGTVNALSDNEYDLVLLDMTMPTFDPGPVDLGRYEPFAGVEVLSEIDRSGQQVPVVVVTQFERFGSGSDAVTLFELDQRLKRDFSESYQGVVFFNSSSAEWRQALSDIVKVVTSRGHQ